MRVKANFIGADKFKDKLGKVDTRSKQALANTVKLLAFRIQSTIRRSFRSPKSGKQYVKGGKTHTASSPGETPAIDTGTLTGNIVVSVNNAAASATVSANTKYASYLEYGTRGDPSRNIPPLQPRPFMRPAFFERTGQSVELLKISWKQFK